MAGLMGSWSGSVCPEKGCVWEAASRVLGRPGLRCPEGRVQVQGLVPSQAHVWASSKTAAAVPSSSTLCEQSPPVSVLLCFVSWH